MRIAAFISTYCNSVFVACHSLSFSLTYKILVILYFYSFILVLSEMREAEHGGSSLGVDFSIQNIRES